MGWPDLPDSDGAALVAHELTETAASDTDAPAVIGISKKSNRAQPTDSLIVTPRLSAYPESDVTSAASSEEGHGNSEYAKLPENLPTISSNMTELKGHIL